jgi:hypothetical protein
MFLQPLKWTFYVINIHLITHENQKLSIDQWTFYVINIHLITHENQKLSFD